MQSGPKKALVLVGVLSGGINAICAGKEYPTIFTDVRKEADWIYKTMKKLEAHRHRAVKTLSESAVERSYVSDIADLKLNSTIHVIVLFVHLLLSIMI